MILRCHLWLTNWSETGADPVCTRSGVKDPLQVPGSVWVCCMLFGLDRGDLEDGGPQSTAGASLSTAPWLWGQLLSPGHRPRFGGVAGCAGDPLPAPAMPMVRLKARDRDGRRIS